MITQSVSLALSQPFQCPYPTSYYCLSMFVSFTNPSITYNYTVVWRFICLVFLSLTEQQTLLVGDNYVCLVYHLFIWFLAQCMVRQSCSKKYLPYGW